MSKIILNLEIDCVEARRIAEKLIDKNKMHALDGFLKTEAIKQVLDNLEFTSISVQEGEDRSDLDSFSFGSPFVPRINDTVEISIESLLTFNNEKFIK